MMRKVKSVVLAVLFVSLVTLLISNPGENAYLRMVSAQYTKHHNNDQISYDVFKNIGKSYRKNYMLFSTFDYTFQERSYFYVGVANQVYYLGARNRPKASRAYMII